MYARLADAGVQIVVHNAFPLDRDGLLPGRGDRLAQRRDGASRPPQDVRDRRRDRLDGRRGHRGPLRDGRVSRRLRARRRGRCPPAAGGLPDELPRATAGRCRRHPARSRSTSRRRPTPGTIPTTLLQNVPGGFLAGTQATRAAIEGARTRARHHEPLPQRRRDARPHRRRRRARRAAVRLLVPDESTTRPRSTR